MSTPIARIVIMGSHHRGLWLAQELALQKFEVTWIQTQNLLSSGDRVWQAGSQNKFEGLTASAQDFVTKTFETSVQENFQVITPLGLFDFSKELLPQSLASFFSSENSQLLEKYKDSIIRNNQSLSGALEHKLARIPKSQRWCLEWMGPLSFHYDNQSIKGSEISLINYLLAGNHSSTFQKNALNWVEGKTPKVKILENSKVIDIAHDGWRVTGIELEQSTGFLPCDELVFSSSSENIKKRYPKFSEKMRVIQGNSVEPKFTWIPVQIKMNKDSKPNGLPVFSSYVIDPLMPLTGPGFGMMKWTKEVDHDKLVVWCKMHTTDMKKQSVIENLVEEIQKNLSVLISSFEMQVISVEIPTITIQSETHDYVYEKDVDIHRGEFKKNLWLAGIETDSRLDFISSLETEKVILDKLVHKYRKELKVDRALHTSPNGKSLGSQPSV